MEVVHSRSTSVFPARNLVDQTGSQTGDCTEKRALVNGISLSHRLMAGIFALVVAPCILAGSRDSDVDDIAFEISTLAKSVSHDTFTEQTSPMPVFAKVESLSMTMGLLGAEIANMPRKIIGSGGGGEKSKSDAVVYANVDEISLSAQDDPLLLALYAAAATRKRILLESDTWSREQVQAVGDALFGVDAGHGQDSALMLAEWSGSEWKVRRSYDEIVASLGRVEPEAPDVGDAKAVGGTVTMSFADLAQAAYTTTSPVSGYKRYYQATDKVVSVFYKDTVFIQDGLTITNRSCVVSWRGSINPEDWYFNIVNFFQGWATLANPTFDAFNTSIVGKGYDDRFTNAGITVTSKLEALGCEDLTITGHSLGSAMAMYHAWRYSYTQANALFKKLNFVRGFNGPAVGNTAWENDYKARVVNLSRITATNKCRYGDPFNGLPAGFNQTCQGDWGVNVSGSTSFVNHEIKWWRQCQSLTSC